jgi:hypothetical protein
MWRASLAYCCTSSSFAMSAWWGTRRRCSIRRVAPWRRTRACPLDPGSATSTWCPSAGLTAGDDRKRTVDRRLTVEAQADLDAAVELGPGCVEVVLDE